MDSKKKKSSKELIVDMEEIIEGDKSPKKEETKPPLYQNKNESDKKQNMLKNQALINAFNLDEDSSEEESDSQEENESEPKLKYQIISTESLSDILKKDNISTITASDRFLVRIHF